MPVATTGSRPNRFIRRSAKGTRNNTAIIWTEALSPFSQPGTFWFSS